MTVDCEYFSLNTNLVPSLPTPKPDPNFDQAREYKLIYNWTLSEMSDATNQQRGAKTATYNPDNMNEVASISSIPEFWRYWNSLPQPSELLEGKKLISQRDNTTVGSVMLFREGIQPAWEDAYNAEGGEFQFRLNKRSFGSNQMGLADELWNNLVLGILGGMIQPCSMVTGIRMLDRLNSKAQMLRFEVWFTSLDKVDVRDLEGWDYNAATGEERAKKYEQMISVLKTNIEHCMTTNLNGMQDKAHAVWGETVTNMHNEVQHAIPVGGNKKY